MKSFTIYARTGGVLLHTDNDELARGSLIRGNRVTRHTFGAEVEMTFQPIAPRPRVTRQDNRDLVSPGLRLGF